MSTAFSEFLTKAAAEEKEKYADEYRADLKWKEEVRKLYASIQEWVKTADPQGLLSVKVQEEDTGYSTQYKDARLRRPDLFLRLGTRCVYLTPAGRNVLGYFSVRKKAVRRALGRVDMSSADDERCRLMLLEADHGEPQEWVIDSDFRLGTRELNKESFLRELQDLLA